MGRRGVHILRGQTSVAKTPHGLSAAQRSSGTGCSYAEVGRCKHHGSMMGSEALMQVGRVSLLLCDWVIHCALHKSCCILLIVLHELVLQGRRLRVAAKTACMHLRIQHRHIDLQYIANITCRWIVHRDAASCVCLRLAIMVWSSHDM